MEREWLIPFAVLATIEYVVALSIAWAIDYPGRPDYFLHFAISAALGGALLFSFFAYHFIRLLRVMAPNPSGELAAVWNENRTRFAAVLVGLVFATLHGIAFNWSKSMLPFVVPFWADKPLADLDEALFGMAAWEWAYRLAGSGSEAFRIAYVAWLPIAIALPVAVICMRASQRKAVLLTAYLLTWIIGGMLA